MMTQPITATVLLIEDDDIERDTVQWQLQEQGFQVHCAPDGREGLRQLYHHQPDLILLDINIPNLDGYTVCQRIREISNIPIIMITARAEPDAIVHGLELGADDYIVKPYEPNVLLARTRATLRRAAAEPTLVRPKVAYNDDYLTINFEERRVLVEQEPIRLTPTEYRLLEMLFQESPRVVAYRILLEDIWGFEYIDDIDYLRVYIWHLRSKLEPDPKNPIYVLNELGVGYRFQRHI